VREFCIYYGSQEVSFDEERLFPFAEQLVTQSEFTAEAAMAWGPGYAWSELQPMFEALVTAGILKRGDPVGDARGGGPVPSRVPPSVCPVPRFWSKDDCEAITRDLGGRAIEIGYLEAILPSYRVAHAALDADGRQVGEANVFPGGLRLDRETEWRICYYPGSRYRDDAPMNVTALKAMIKHWKPIVAALLEVRREVLGRLPRSRAGWTAGDLHTFARVVLAVPAYQLMLRGGVSPQPPLHPVLSSLFRVTDGVRMATHDLLFLSAERTRAPDEPFSAAELYGFTERNGLFLSEYGVCAGPKAMIDEFFSVLFDGTVVPGADPRELPAEVCELLAHLPAAIDYGLLGLQVWAVSRSVWLAMRDVLRGLLDLVEHATDPGAARLRRRLRDAWPAMERERIATDSDHEVHRVVYADAYEQAWRGLAAPVGPATLGERVAPVAHRPSHAALTTQLRGILLGRFGDHGLGGVAANERFVELVMRYLRIEQAVLAGTSALQRELNARLDRPQPTRVLEVRDFLVTFALHGDGPEFHVPYVLDVLDDELGIHVTCTADLIELTDRRAGPTPADHPTRHAGGLAGGQ
jgi:hypothetical protein